MIHDSPWVWFGSFGLSVALVAFLQRRYRIDEVIIDRVRRFRKAVGNITMPFAVIAKELRRMNDLKELELAERLNPKTGEREPVIMITEVPGRNDTEVFWGVEPDAHGKASMRQALQRQWEGELEAEEAEE